MFVVTFGKVYLLTEMPYFTGTPNRIAIDITIANNSGSTLAYSSMVNSWGSILASDGSQLNESHDYYSNNASYYSGSSILAGATITDTISFTAYSGAPISFKLIGELPVGDKSPYDLTFLFSDIGSKAAP